ncbi:MAG: HAD family hydrolase [Candidatus Aenigmatarchaeota archaeon]
MRLKCIMIDFGETIADGRMVYNNVDKEYNLQFWRRLGFSGSLEDLENARIKNSADIGKITSQKNVSKTTWAKMFAKKLGLEITEKDAEEEFRGFIEYYKRNVRLFPNVKDTLDFIKNNGLKLVLISNGWKELNTILEYLDLDRYFDLVIISKDIEAYKSEGIPFKIAMEKMSLKPEECIMVGDNLKEDACSRRIGIKFCWFNPFGAEAKENNFDFEIKDFKDIQGIVESSSDND